MDKVNGNEDESTSTLPDDAAPEFDDDVDDDECVESANGMQLLRNNVHVAPLPFSPSLQLPSLVSPVAPSAAAASAAATTAALFPMLSLLLSRFCLATINRCNSRGKKSGLEARISSEVSSNNRIMADSSDVAGVYGEMDKKDS